MADDLFDAAATERLGASAPLAERMRPVSFDEVAGHDALVGDRGTLRRLVGAQRLPSIVLWGPAGSGKTTLARLITKERADHCEPLSATSATVADIRRVVADATTRLGSNGVRTVLFLDEIHRFTRTQQDALLPSVESGLLSLIGATTESPWATLVGPLLSRCTVIRLEPLAVDAMEIVVARAVARSSVSITDEALAVLINVSDGDARKALTTLEMAIALGGHDPGEIDVPLIREGLAAGDLRYGTGVHYDSASAFIKWMRHSDPAQAVAWMVHMLDGGEDPRFVARRMVIFASEDIGPADPRALLIADAAARAVESVGMPEARYVLGQAAGYLARAPKSRAVPSDLEAAGSTERILPPEMTKS